MVSYSKLRLLSSHCNVWVLLCSLFFHLSISCFILKGRSSFLVPRCDLLLPFPPCRCLSFVTLAGCHGDVARDTGTIVTWEGEGTCAQLMSPPPWG